MIERDGYVLGGYRIGEGRCTRCQAPIAGRFDDTAGRLGRPPHARPHRQIVPPQPVAAGPSRCPVLSEEQQQRVFRAAGRPWRPPCASWPAPATPAILGEIAEAPVYGSFVSLKRGGQLRACCGFLGTSVSLAEAVANAAVRAAREDPRFPPIAAAELDSLDMEVWLLWGLQPVAARGRDRLQAVTIGKHGVQIARGQARGLLLPCVAIDHHLDAKGLLQQVCLKAGLPTDAWLHDNTTLMTFEGYAIGGRLREAIAEPPPADDADQEEPSPTGLRPGPGNGNAETAEDRSAAVAGTFYPARRAEIDQMLDEFFAQGPAETPQAWPAALVPHAGWIYSGRLAAAVLGRVQIPGRVIIFCPRHHFGGAAWAVAPYRQWLIPGGQVTADLELARQLAARVKGLQLRRPAPPARTCHRGAVAAVGAAVAANPRRGHHHRRGRSDGLVRLCRAIGRRAPRSARTAAAVDLQRHESLRRRGPHQAAGSLGPGRHRKPGSGGGSTKPSGSITSACAECIPRVIVMETLRQLDRLHRCEEVGYTTSATRTGDTRRVVGYAGVLLG